MQELCELWEQKRKFLIHCNTCTNNLLQNSLSSKVDIHIDSGIQFMIQSVNRQRHNNKH